MIVPVGHDNITFAVHCQPTWAVELALLGTVRTKRSQSLSAGTKDADSVRIVLEDVEFSILIHCHSTGPIQVGDGEL